MDNNNPVSPTPTEPVTEPVPTVDPTSNEQSSSNKKIILLVVILLVLSLAVGGFYFYSNQTKKQTNVVPSPTATDTSLNSLDADLQSVDASSPDDLSTIDQDLKNL